MNKYIKIGFGFMLGFCSLVSCDTMDTENLEAYDEELVWSHYCPLKMDKVKN